MLQTPAPAPVLLLGEEGRGGDNLSHGPYTGGQWVAANTELGDTAVQLPVDNMIKIGKMKICSHV